MGYFCALYCISDDKKWQQHMDNAPTGKRIVLMKNNNISRERINVKRFVFFSLSLSLFLLLFLLFRQHKGFSFFIWLQLQSKWENGRGFSHCQWLLLWKNAYNVSKMFVCIVTEGRKKNDDSIFAWLKIFCLECKLKRGRFFSFVLCINVIGKCERCISSYKDGEFLLDIVVCEMFLLNLWEKKGMWEGE